MSILIMSKVWQSAPYKGADLLVLLALADFASDDGKCWPSVGTLREKSRISERHAQKILRKLEADGILERTYRDGTSTVYTLYPERLKGGGILPPRQNAGVNPMTPGGELEATPPPSPVTPGGGLGDTQTINEPSPNHQESLSPSERESSHEREIKEEYLSILAASGDRPVGLKMKIRNKLASGDIDQIEDFEKWRKKRAAEARKAKEIAAAKRFGQQQLIGYQLPDGGIVAQIIGIETTERDGVPGFSFSVTLDSGVPQSIFVPAEEILEEDNHAA